MPDIKKEKFRGISVFRNIPPTFLVSLSCKGDTFNCLSIIQVSSECRKRGEVSANVPPQLRPHLRQLPLSVKWLKFTAESKSKQLAFILPCSPFLATGFDFVSSLWFFPETESMWIAKKRSLRKEFVAGYRAKNTFLTWLIRKKTLGRQKMEVWTTETNKFWSDAVLLPFSFHPCVLPLVCENQHAWEDDISVFTYLRFCLMPIFWWINSIWLMKGKIGRA